MKKTATKVQGRNPGKNFHSLFFKLFATLLGTLALTLLALALFFRPIWNPESREITRQNLRQYAELLTQQIGTPPDTVLAERMSRRLKLGIAILDPDGRWWFSGSISAPMRERIEERHAEHSRMRIENRMRAEGDSSRARIRKGRIVATVPREGYRFFYGTRHRQPVEIRPHDWFLLLGAVSGIGFLTWILLRRLLLPVRDLARGVRAVGEGNLDVRIPERGKDELGELATAFNAMAGNLNERLRARDQLLLDVSHELRSPLTRMRVAHEMAQPGTAVDSLREEITALDSMITEVLETERMQSGPGQLKRQPTDLAALVDEVVKEHEESGAGVVWRKPAEFPPVRCDAERMRRVVRNLVTNAQKYGGDPGLPVEMSLRTVPGPKSHDAVLEVRDHGPGIPDAEKKLVFEPFYRVDRSRSHASGYGLGLPLCKRILEAHGGSITIADAEGGGTRVVARIPVA